MNRGITILIVLVIVTALGVVHVRHKNRVRFVELQNLHTERDRLNVEWTQLLLEQATWSLHHVVDKEARTKLDMVMPPADEIVTLHIPGLNYQGDTGE
jgi:cell division protein FtsL